MPTEMGWPFVPSVPVTTTSHPIWWARTVSRRRRRLGSHRGASRAPVCGPRCGTRPSFYPTSFLLAMGESEDGATHRFRSAEQRRPEPSVRGHLEGRGWGRLVLGAAEPSDARRIGGHVAASTVGRTDAGSAAPSSGWSLPGPQSMMGLAWSSGFAPRSIVSSPGPPSTVALPVVMVSFPGPPSSVMSPSGMRLTGRHRRHRRRRCLTGISGPKAYRIT